MTSEREYLDFERNSEFRHELIDGRVIVKPGSNRWHSLIILNLAGLLWSQLRGRPCEAHATDMRVKVSATGMYTYPDLVVACGEPRYEDTHIDTLLNPTVIIEVLSDSTEKYDRGEKFAHYRRLDTLREYVLVSQDKMRIEHYRRDGEEWRLSEISDPASVLHLPAIDCHIELAAIYEKVDFAA